MADNNQAEEQKGSGQKVQIPDPNEQISVQAAATAETTADDGEASQPIETGAEERKGPKVLDQSKSNMPIQSDIDDLKELLKQNESRLNMNINEKKILTNAIEKGTFKTGAAMVKASL